MKPETYYVRTFGCQMNERDSERIAALLEAMGYIPGDERADVVIVNTCSVREKPEHKVYSELGRYGGLKRRRPGMILAVAGCVAQQEGETLLKRIPHLDLVMGARAIARLPQLISAAKNGERIVATEMNGGHAAGLFGAERPAPRSPTAFVVAMTGCSSRCTYCVVPNVRGPAVSRPKNEIIEEVASLAAAGVKEVTLLGQNVNAYGLDFRNDAVCCATIKDKNDAPDFAELLELVSAVPGIERVRFTTSHPKDLSDRLIRVMAENQKVCKYLHLPIQAGADRVLERMGRGYTRAQYLDLARRLREAVPEIALSSDFIVGFPGESDEEFRDTLDVIEQVRYHQIYSFCYSERPNTSAPRDEAVEPQAKLERLHVLQAKQDQITREIMEAYVGGAQTILIEGASKTDRTRSTGRTQCNLPVHVGGIIEPGTLITVRITRALKHSLEGEHVK